MFLQFTYFVTNLLIITNFTWRTFHGHQKHVEDHSKYHFSETELFHYEKIIYLTSNISTLLLWHIQV